MQRDEMTKAIQRACVRACASDSEIDDDSGLDCYLCAVELLGGLEWRERRA